MGCKGIFWSFANYFSTTTNSTIILNIYNEVRLNFPSSIIWFVLRVKCTFYWRIIIIINSPDLEYSLESRPFIGFSLRMDQMFRYPYIYVIDFIDRLDWCFTSEATEWQSLQAHIYISMYFFTALSTNLKYKIIKLISWKRDDSDNCDQRYRPGTLFHSAPIQSGITMAAKTYKRFSERN